MIIFPLHAVFAHRAAFAILFQGSQGTAQKILHNCLSWCSSHTFPYSTAAHLPKILLSHQDILPFRKSSGSGVGMRGQSLVSQSTYCMHRRVRATPVSGWRGKSDQEYRQFPCNNVQVPLLRYISFHFLISLFG